MRSRTLPCPPVILAIMSLPQRTTIIPAIRTRLSKAIIIPVMILRFLLAGFLDCFIVLPFWFIVEAEVLEVTVGVAVSSPLCSSKLKAWTGFKKSSVLARGAEGFWGVDFLGTDFLGVETLDTEVLGAGTLGTEVLETEVLGVEILDAETGAFLARRDSSPSIDLFLFIAYNYSIMATKLTKKQLAVLEFIGDFTEERGFSPSYREIMTGLGLASVSAVAEHVDNLVNRGVLKKVPGAARSLEILDYKHEETVALFQEKIAVAGEEEKKILEQAAGILGLDLE